MERDGVTTMLVKYSFLLFVYSQYNSSTVG